MRSRRCSTSSSSSARSLLLWCFYWSKLWPFHRKRIPQRSWFAQQSTNGFVGGLQRFGDRYCCMDKIVMWLKIAVSCLPAMLIGLPLNDWLDKHFYNPTVVALMLLLYGA